MSKIGEMKMNNESPCVFFQNNLIRNMMKPFIDLKMVV